MGDNEIKIFEHGRERETIRGLTLSQMNIISMILQRHGVSHKKFTYQARQLVSVDWVGASDLRAALERILDDYEGMEEACGSVVRQARAALGATGANGD
jgi:hypothetical protein